MLVSPIISPTGLVSCLGGGVVLETVVSAPVPLSEGFPQFVNNVATAIINIISFHDRLF